MNSAEGRGREDVRGVWSLGEGQTQGKDHEESHLIPTSSLGS